MSQQPEPIFVDINPDQPVTTIESVCLNCHEQVLLCIYFLRPFHTHTLLGNNQLFVN